MAKKTKDFSIVADTIKQATQEDTTAQETQKKTRKGRKTYTDKEAAEIMSELKTRGHKGVKAPRINLALSPDNYLYVRTCARAAGTTYAEIINKALDDHREAHAETYEEMQRFRNLL